MNIRIAKNYLLATALLIAVTNILNAQNYALAPNDTIVGTVPFNDIYHFNIEQTNLTAGKLVFSWQRITVEIPAGWESNLCDNGNCYAGFPLNGTMDTVFNGDYGLMSVAVNPFEIAGIGFIQYKIWEASTPGQQDTLTWIITASGETVIHETLNTSIHLYPNPANNSILLATEINTGYEFTISNIYGQEIYSGYAASASEQIETNKLPNGNYILIIRRESQILNSIQFLINHSAK
jgi:hypothetical protein